MSKAEELFRSCLGAFLSRPGESFFEPGFLW